MKYHISAFLQPSSVIFILACNTAGFQLKCGIVHVLEEEIIPVSSEVQPMKGKARR